MSDDSTQDKTEEPSQRKLGKMREEGQVPKSADATSAIVLAGGAVMLYATGTVVGTQILDYSRRIFRLQDVGRPEVAIAGLAPALLKSVGPTVLAVAILACLVTLAQTRANVSMNILQFNVERLNPFPKWKMFFPTKDTLLEVAKSSIKMLAVGFVAYKVILSELPFLAVLPSAAPTVAAIQVGAAGTRVVVYTAIAFAIVSIFDYLLNYYKWREESMMSHEELKEEAKQSEGDPKTRGKIRSMQREMGKRQALTAVKDSTVIVANPTHISVALRYKPEQDVAPIVLAKGVDHLAMLMRKEARKHGIPIVENRPLARALHASAKLGWPIPFDLYRAAAEIIAHVMRIKGAVA